MCRCAVLGRAATPPAIPSKRVAGVNFLVDISPFLPMLNPLNSSRIYYEDVLNNVYLPPGTVAGGILTGSGVFSAGAAGCVEPLWPVEAPGC